MRSRRVVDYGMAKKPDVEKLQTLADQRGLRKEAKQNLVDLTARVMGADRSRLLERAKSTYGTKGLSLEQQMRALVEDLLIVTRFEEFQMRMVEESLMKPLEYMKVIALLGPKKLEVEHEFKPVIFLPPPISQEAWEQRVQDREAKMIEAEIIRQEVTDGDELHEHGGRGEGGVVEESEADPGETSQEGTDGGGKASA